MACAAKRALFSDNETTGAELLEMDSDAALIDFGIESEVERAGLTLAIRRARSAGRERRRAPLVARILSAGSAEMQQMH